MKDLLKIAAALAVIAGAVFVIARYGSQMLAKLKHLCGCGQEDGCCCSGVCACEDECACDCEDSAAQEAPVVEETPVEEAPAEEAVTPEDFAD